MSDKMTSMPFLQLLQWILDEKKAGSIFGIRKYHKKTEGQKQSIFGETLEMPYGPAAGPHTQLAQNIVAAYLTGSRFFELKTVQIMDGEELAACVNKPCILAEDEGYNCEWSTELYVPQAYEEYVKAWVLLHILSKELGLGDPDGFVFNMSVGYDLAGIQSEKIDTFIEQMKEAKDSPVFRQCIRDALSMADQLEHVTREDIMAIPSAVSRSVTLSTLHGCPPQEIEKIAMYLMKEKHVHTFVKCNPTLLGYETARKLMDDMGYDYVAFGAFHFEDDLQFEDAVPMLERLQAAAKEEGLEFGVKLTNTFPVDVTAKELPSEEMYMSGKALTILSLSVAKKLSDAFDGRLRISYSGGADAFNIKEIYECGIWPITMATYFLKPGGYERGIQIGKLLEGCGAPKEGVDQEALLRLIDRISKDDHYRKPVKPVSRKKIPGKAPLTGCFQAPCSYQCPIHQDIPAYVKLTGEGRYEEAMKVITDTNPLPWMTGTICNHRCMTACSRNFYEESVQIREMKRQAAIAGYDDLLSHIRNQRAAYEKQGESPKARVAVVGGGPAGIAAAYFLARGGAQVTVYERRHSLGGTVRYVIPAFRISFEDVDKDVALAKAMGAEFVTGHSVTGLDEFADKDAVILAVGAHRSIPLDIDSENEWNALNFLEQYKYMPDAIPAGKHVVVIGAGNTAMDAARAAKRLPGVEDVTIVYRRTRRYMPADEEELKLAMEDGVRFEELLAPVRQKDGELTCRRMRLGEPDESGRRRPVETDEEVTIHADLVIAALGEKIDSDFYTHLGLDVTEKGYPVTDGATCETSKPGVYVIGDGNHGADTVVTAIRDARMAAEHILGKYGSDADTVEGKYSYKETFSVEDEKKITARRGKLFHSDSRLICGEPAAQAKEADRCLECGQLCENCTEVCPNRANIAIRVEDLCQPVILHVDWMCNECGNCRTFCPYDSAPYKDKLTVFSDASAMEESSNDGFARISDDGQLWRVRLDGQTADYSMADKEWKLPEAVRQTILAAWEEHAYLFM